MVHMCTLLSHPFWWSGSMNLGLTKPAVAFVGVHAVQHTSVVRCHALGYSKDKNKLQIFCNSSAYNPRGTMSV